jgi:hypothetical protein
VLALTSSNSCWLFNARRSLYDIRTPFDIDIRIRQCEARLHINLTLMDQWALYIAGKISKPTQSSQLLRLDPHGDFVVEYKNHPPREGSELTDLSG